MLEQQKIVFVDRDGTLIVEPPDKQVDSVAKLSLMRGVVLALHRLIAEGHVLVMVSNQDGLGTSAFPEEQFAVPHQLMLDIFASQGIVFEAVRICPHTVPEQCACRKPKVGLVMDYLRGQKMNKEKSYVVGDRATDMEFAHQMGIVGIHLGSHAAPTWEEVVDKIILAPRSAVITRKTKETLVKVAVNLDSEKEAVIDTGIGFFNHMLAQLAKHGQFALSVEVQGDLEVDEHHTIEDTALALGEAIRIALGDKRGIERYGYILPMDEALAHIALDLSGRAYCAFKGDFKRDCIGGLPTELVPHFFRSFAETLRACLHLEVKGENTHHMVEALFKGTGRALQQAIRKTGSTQLPSTKGAL